MRILVMGDKIKNLNLIKSGLEEDNYEVDMAFDEESGLHMAAQNSYSLIALDLAFTKKVGIRVVRELKARKIMVPVLLLSSKKSWKDVISVLSKGSVDYLDKPFVFAEFLARVRAILRRSELVRGLNYALLTSVWALSS